MSRDRFWITLLLSIPTLLWSGMVQHTLGFQPPPFRGSVSRASYQERMQNLWWAAGYNIVAIPLAAGELAAQGVLLPPAFAAGSSA